MGGFFLGGWGWGLLGVNSFSLFFSHTCPVPFCLSVCLCLVFGGWAIECELGFLMWFVCVWVCVCLPFFHTSYTAPKFSYVLYEDNEIYLTCPELQSVCLSVFLYSLCLVGWLAGLLVWVRERKISLINIIIKNNCCI